mgnify:CR=1 FL=1
MFSWVELLLSRTLTTVDAKPIAAIMTRTQGAAGIDWGVLAAAGIVALTEMVDRLVDDHANARRLANAYGNDFHFVFIYPSVDLTTEERANDAQMFGPHGVYAERGSFALAELLGVTSTGDVFVLDREHRLSYRGAVDDQYGLGYTRDVPTAHYLRNALDDLRESRPVRVPATSAPGCYIDADPAKDRLIPSMPGGHLLS